MNTSILKATDANFNEVISSAKPVLVDFWAEWCGPCRAIAPTLDQLAESLESKVTIAKLNVDENPEVSMEYGITSIPALLIFKNGKVVDKLVGAAPKSKIEAKLLAQLN